MTKSTRPKPTSLDSVTMCSISTGIACNGLEQARLKYIAWCKANEYPIEPWVIRYYDLYGKYRATPKGCDNYIDVEAAQRALREA